METQKCAGSPSPAPRALPHTPQHPSSRAPSTFTLATPSSCSDSPGRVPSRSMRQPRQAKKKRIMNYRLVQIEHIPKEVAHHKVLGLREYLGRYGPLANIYLTESKSPDDSAHKVMSAYATYETEVGAALALLGTHNVEHNGRRLKANYGTNRYCQSFLEGRPCGKDKCFYLHEYDYANDAKDPKHSKDKHIWRAFTTVMKNLRPVVMMENQEAKTKNKAVKVQFRLISCVLARMIEKGVLKQQQYEVVKSRSGTIHERRVFGKRSYEERVNSVIFKQDPPLSTDSDYESAGQYCKMTQSMVLPKAQVQPRQEKSSCRSTTSNSEKSQECRHHELDQMIRFRLIRELHKKRHASKMDFAARQIGTGVACLKESEEARMLREKMIQYLLLG